MHHATRQRQNRITEQICVDCGEVYTLRMPWEDTGLPGPCEICSAKLREHTRAALECRRWNAVFSASGIPDRFNGLTLTESSQRVQIPEAGTVPTLGEDVTWVRLEGVPTIHRLRTPWIGNVILTGPANAGKSRLAAGWALDAARSGQAKRVRWLSVLEWAQVYRLAYDNDLRCWWEARLSVEYPEVEALVVDGLEMARGKALEPLEALMRRRWDVGLQTLITSRDPWPWTSMHADTLTVERMQ